jgi:hypothetical protein
MKIFVITANSWNGEHDVISVEGLAFYSEEEAIAWVKERNLKRTSSYSPEYEYQVIEVK